MEKSDYFLGEKANKFKGVMNDGMGTYTLETI
jgi:hypothetical protein